MCENMKIKLINVAEYDLKDEKTSKVTFNSFVNLCGEVGTNEKGDLKRARLFKNIEAFKNCSTDDMQEMNQEEDVRILENGQFIIFLKD